MQIKQDRIGVFVRIRPYQEKQPPSTFIVSQTDKDITVKDTDRDKQQDLRFSYDRVFPPKTEQRELFETVGQPIVDAAFDGINGTIFAYGQTSSGKTFTCVGPDCEDPNTKGLLPRCVSGIFDRISGSPNYLQFRIKVSMVQIYMERIKDLLDPVKNDLKIRENKSKGIYIQDVTEQYVSNPDQAMRVFKKGVSNRAVAFTSMNDVSSRSHMAFILTLHQNNLKDGSAKSGKITVVDLAGSEKVSKTKAEDKVLNEAKQINKSLLSLGNVINALTDGKVAHVPYRDSKLTRLLQESLGGNSKTSLIINVSPSSYNANESMSSLRFGFRAKEIKNKPKINKEYTIAQLLVLLQKSQRRNQQLELMLKELTASASKKQKKKGSGFIQNLLDSDNPIMSPIEDLQPDLPQRRSVIRTIKKYYESEVGEDDDGEERFKKKAGQTPIEVKSMEINLCSSVEVEQERERREIELHLQSVITQKQEELSILGQELNRINSERVDMVRELDICRQRLQCATKEARINVMKYNAEKKEGENLLQKYIRENLQNQQKEENISNLHSKILAFQEKFIKLSQLHSESVKQTNVFGLAKDVNQETSRILDEVLKEGEEDEDLKKEAMQALQREKKISELSARVKQLQSQVCTFHHLQESKEDFIKEKIKFIGERDRIYKDLQNRIQKVLYLQQKLDEQRQRRTALEELVHMQQSQKVRKIQSLQRHINSVNEEYYVLKGQQSSWKKNNDRLEKKLSEQLKKLSTIQSENLQLRVEVQNWKMRSMQLQAWGENGSVLDFQFSEREGEDTATGNIVKVVRSSIAQQG